MKVNAHRKRGISPAITSIILIGVAVAAGVTSYSVFTSTANITSSRGAFVVEAVNIAKQANGEQWISITIKNTGNKAFSSSQINLQIDTDGAVDGIQPFTSEMSPSALNPGQTGSTTARITNGEGLPVVAHNIGDALPLEIVATMTDGSTVREVMLVSVGMS